MFMLLAMPLFVITLFVLVTSASNTSGVLKLNHSASTPLLPVSPHVIGAAHDQRRGHQAPHALRRSMASSPAARVAAAQKTNDAFQS
jgi:hypothetical protein